MTHTDTLANSDTLGHRIRAARLLAGLSQQEAAAAAGIRQATWSHIETGKQDPSASVLVRIAAVLGVRPGQLLDD